MKLLVGLGNPGAEYEQTRHNIGFMAVDAIAHRHNFSSPKLKYKSEIYDGIIEGEKVLIQKPLTYMNLSGTSVQEFSKFYKISLDDIIVFHDELDLAFGKIKIKQGGGNGGHNGIKSLDSHCGNAYHRVRLGIGHPGDKDKVSGYVLSKFSSNEMQHVESWVDHIAEAIPLLLSKDDNVFLTRLALLTQPKK